MAERVGIGLDLDPQLAAGYELLQGAMTALEEHDVDQLMDLLFTKWDVPAPFQTVLKTLRKNSEGVTQPYYRTPTVGLRGSTA